MFDGPFSHGKTSAISKSPNYTKKNVQDMMKSVVYGGELSLNGKIVRTAVTNDVVRAQKMLLPKFLLRRIF